MAGVGFAEIVVVPQSGRGDIPKLRDGVESDGHVAVSARDDGRARRGPPGGLDRLVGRSTNCHGSPFPLDGPAVRECRRREEEMSSRSRASSSVVHDRVSCSIAETAPLGSSVMRVTRSMATRWRSAARSISQARWASISASRRSRARRPRSAAFRHLSSQYLRARPSTFGAGIGPWHWGQRSPPYPSCCTRGDGSRCPLTARRPGRGRGGLRRGRRRRPAQGSCRRGRRPRLRRVRPVIRRGPGPVRGLRRHAARAPA